MKTNKDYELQWNVQRDCFGFQNIIIYSTRDDNALIIIIIFATVIILCASTYTIYGPAAENRYKAQVI